MSSVARPIPFAAAFALAGFPALAAELPPVHCTSGEKVWFSGYAKDLDTIISFCGSESMEGDDAWLQMRYGEVGGSLVYHPPEGSDWYEAFEFSRSTRPRATYLILQTSVDGLTYLVVDAYDVDDPAVAGGSLTMIFADGNGTSHPLTMTTEPLSIFGLEDHVTAMPRIWNEG